MTDYLELLLERRQEEDEEDREVLTLGPENEAFPRKREPRGTGEDLEAPSESQTRKEREPAGPMAAAQAGAPALRSAAPRPNGSGSGVTRRRPGTAGELLEQRLELAQDALAGRAEGPAPAVPESAGPLPGRGTALAAGAEGLARRLAQMSLAATPAPARVVFDGDAGTDPAAADWEAFDRLLERDARRYDGGLGLY